MYYLISDEQRYVSHDTAKRTIFVGKSTELKVIRASLSLYFFVNVPISLFTLYCTYVMQRGYSPITWEVFCFKYLPDFVHKTDYIYTLVR